MDLKIITNHVPRNLVYGYELTDKERAKFDYVKPDEIDSHDFFRYKGRIYDPREFMVISRHAPEPMQSWDGYSSDTFFSGILIKYVNDNEQVIVGMYMS